MSLISSFRVQILMASRANIKMFTSFHRVIQRDKRSKFSTTTITFSSSHSSFKNYQRILVFLDRVSNLILGQYPQIFENDNMVTSIQMPKKVRSSKHNSQIFQFGLTHFKDQIGSLLLNIILILHRLIRKGDDLSYFLLGYRPIKVKILFDKAK